MPGVRVMLLVATVLLLSACAAMGNAKNKAGVFPRAGTAEQKLAIGLENYDEGDYRYALAVLREAEKMGLSRKDDKVAVHKYLAFIYCITDRKNQCRHEFEDVLEADPDFELEAAEAGHPIWGPVFRGVKDNFAK